MTLKGRLNLIGFIFVHAACAAAFWTGVSPWAIGLCAASYLIRMFGITAGYHRYFSHQTYKMNRVVQFAVAWIGCASTQKGPLWWASHHRNHHLYADKPNDPHSPIRDGFFWSHMGWFLSPQYDATNEKLIPDLMKFPELVWMNKYFLLPPVSWAVGCLLLGGMEGLVWGFFISTTILLHSTFLINSVAHLIGRRRYATVDNSRNSFLLALLTLGEGWHNNHHYYPSATNQGFYWWEIDLTYYGLKLMQALGLAADLRTPPVKIRDIGRTPKA